MRSTLYLCLAIVFLFINIPGSSKSLYSHCWLLPLAGKQFVSSTNSKKGVTSWELSVVTQSALCAVFASLIDFFFPKEAMF